MEVGIAWQQWIESDVPLADSQNAEQDDGDEDFGSGSDASHEYDPSEGSFQGGSNSDHISVSSDAFGSATPLASRTQASVAPEETLARAKSAMVASGLSRLWLTPCRGVLRRSPPAGIHKGSAAHFLFEVDS
ncbi:hypothetical protein Cni_G19688 [Canna indica]|uniref:Uncharacterized protein n=1 Tax=Canna indica TaxID=4628 RepID=A0AAQ3KPY2_9LILI|nr:hypothetical protein Cni_G19688 [Canna indica]